MLSPPFSVHPQLLCAVIGRTACVFLLPWMLFHSFPHLQTGLLTPMAVQGELTPSTLILLYLILIASSYLHNESYFVMVSSIGAVQTGLLNAIRAICVFGLSSAFFCQRDAQQCYSMAKGIATLLVVHGILLFSWGKHRQQQTQGKKDALYPTYNGKAKQTPLLQPIDSLE